VDVPALAVSRAVPRERSSRITSPWLVAAIVAVGYLALIGPGLARNPYDYVNIGRKFLHQSTTSKVIQPSLPTTHRVGYDGQFYFFLAADPTHAKDYIESGSPGIIYSRIGYPMTVRALSGGDAAVVPYMLVLVNIAAAVGGTLAIAFLLRRRGLPPALALLYGFFPGLMFAVLRDLTEPMAFGLVAAALLVFDARSNRRLLASASLLALAMLTRETVALFPAVLTVALLVGAGTASRLRDRIRLGNLVRAAAFAAVAIVPLFAWRHVVQIWLHTTAVQERPEGGPARGLLYSLVPFHAYADQWVPPSGEDVTNLLAVVLPGLVWAAIAVAVLRRKRTIEPWFVLANVAAFVVFLPTSPAVDYASMGRAAIGIVLAVLVSLPRVAESLRERWTVAQRALALWSLPYYLVLAILLNGIPKLL
jgi:hypothetical protein